MNKFISGAAKYIIPRLLEKPYENYAKKQEKKNSEFLESSETHSNFIIARKNGWIKSFIVIDRNEEIVYTIKRSLNPFKMNLNVFDSNGIKVGMIKHKLFKFINIIVPFRKVFETDIIINIVKIGSLKRIAKFLESTYELDFNDWSIEMTKLGSNTIIKNGDNIVMQLDFDFSISHTEYLIKILEIENVFLCLMISFALKINSLGYTRFS